MDNYLTLNSSSNIKYKSASVIKIFIMIEAYNQINKEILSSNSSIILEDYMKVGGSGVLSGYPNGSSHSIDDLIFLMITESDNTATNILIDILGMTNINNLISQLDCTDTELNRKMMDMNAINNGIDNYTSVYDLYITLERLYNKTCINEVYDTKMLDILKQVKSNSKIPSQLPNNVAIAHKTGELTSVENDAAIIFSEQGDYILCILTSEGSNNEEVQFISDISKVIYDEFTPYKSN